MSKIHFLLPSLYLKAQALAFRQSFYDNHEHTINGSCKLDNEAYTYEMWVDLMDRNRQAETANPLFGTSDTYFAADDDGNLVGILTIRFELTDFYKDSGHIGYSVVPQQRRKGYATQMLSEALVLCAKKGLREVKLVCASDNIASRKTIIHCGGEVNRLIFKETGCCAEYCIDLGSGLLTQYEP